MPRLPVMGHHVLPCLTAVSRTQCLVVLETAQGHRVLVTDQVDSHLSRRDKDKGRTTKAEELILINLPLTPGLGILQL